jgi:hypothetical protein
VCTKTVVVDGNRLVSVEEAAVVECNIVLLVTAVGATSVDVVGATSVDVVGATSVDVVGATSVDVVGAALVERDMVLLVTVEGAALVVVDEVEASAWSIVLETHFPCVSN